MGKPRLLSVLALLATCAVWAGAAGQERPVAGGVNFHFATTAEAAAVLGAEDAFTAAMSPFDRSARLKTVKEVTTRAFTEFAARQALPWTQDEQAVAERTLAAVNRRLAPLALPWPEQVLLIKTTGREEGYAAYTRGAAIILPARDAARLREKTVIHELFHVLSRARPDLRTVLYPVLGFTTCPAIELPPVLRNEKITNPDAPAIDCWIEVAFAATPTKVAPVLLSGREKYDVRRGGEFFEYMNFMLLQVDTSKDGRVRPVAVGVGEHGEGRPVLFDPPRTNYSTLVGQNTEYIIHPEEILADNFALLLAPAAADEAKTRWPKLAALHKAFAAWAGRAASQPATRPA